MNYSHLCTPCYAYNGNGAWQVDLLGVSPGWVLRIPLFFFMPLLICLVKPYATAYSIELIVCLIVMCVLVL